MNNNVLNAQFFSLKSTLFMILVAFFQQALMIPGTQLVVSVVVAEAVCTSNNDVFKARRLSSTHFMILIALISASSYDSSCTTGGVSSRSGSSVCIQQRCIQGQTS